RPTFVRGVTLRARSVKLRNAHQDRSPEMTLVAGRGPLSKDPAGWFSSPLPDDLVFVEPHPRRVQAIRNRQTVIDTERALMVHRRDHPLSYAFPAEDVGGLPNEPEPEAPGYVHVPWHAVDTWLEEGRKLVHYPPNPYHRVDCRRTNRGLRVTVAGATLGDTAVDDVGWSYADPPPECLPIKGYLSFDAARAEVLAGLPASDKAHDCG